MNDVAAPVAPSTETAAPAAPTGSPAPAPAPGSWVPEKFHVKSADGSLDIEASGAKLVDSYKSLERRLHNSPSAPVPFEGQYAAPKDFPMEAEDVQAAFGEFLDGAKKLGFTQEQMDYVLGQYLPHAQSLVQGAQELDVQAMETALRQTWTDQAAFRRGMDNAWVATQAMASRAGLSPDEATRAVGNNPALVRMLASIGAEFREGSVPNVTGGAPAGMSIEALQKHPAYADPKHPQHEQVSAAVRGYYEARYGHAPAL